MKRLFSSFFIKLLIKHYDHTWNKTIPSRRVSRQLVNVARWHLPIQGDFYSIIRCLFTLLLIHSNTNTIFPSQTKHEELLSLLARTARVVNLGSNGTANADLMVENEVKMCFRIFFPLRIS